MRTLRPTATGYWRQKHTWTETVANGTTTESDHRYHTPTYASGEMHAGKEAITRTMTGSTSGGATYACEQYINTGYIVFDFVGVGAISLAKLRIYDGSSKPQLQISVGRATTAREDSTISSTGSDNIRGYILPLGWSETDITQLIVPQQTGDNYGLVISPRQSGNLMREIDPLCIELLTDADEQTTASGKIIVGGEAKTIKTRKVIIDGQAKTVISSKVIIDGEVH